MSYTTFVPNITSSPARMEHATARTDRAYLVASRRDCSDLHTLSRPLARGITTRKTVCRQSPDELEHSLTGFRTFVIVALLHAKVSISWKNNAARATLCISTCKVRTSCVPVRLQYSLAQHAGERTHALHYPGSVSSAHSAFPDSTRLSDPRMPARLCYRWREPCPASLHPRFPWVAGQLFMLVSVLMLLLMTCRTTYWTAGLNMARRDCDCVSPYSRARWPVYIW